ncbi:DcaP family trimeric outer membrane transporter [Lysobacter niastensis]|uniref:Porin n=1 Tax=Lysobacter niastensis TaxID=380629 RepID=A0ABS0BGG9_9GAMM|nr:DcaP family trimeric outer membrane transporter [Lysobacter niastensis]MBF6026039.1 porin [Lysobacter niastensis]
MSVCIATPRGRRTLLHRPLAAALLVALVLPGVAFAQTAKEQELEARVAQLEAMVKQLAAQQQAQTAEAKAAPAPATPVAAAPVAVPGGAPATAKPAIQSAPIMATANPGTRFTYGGFIKLDASVTQTNDGDIPDGTVGRLFYVPKAIPVGAGNANEDGADTDMGVNFSRFWFGADTDLDSGDKLKAYLEFDLFGGGSTAFTGNEVATNTYALTLRQAYVQWNGWLAGQTWSNFQDVAAMPDTVDFLGPTEGTVFVRQAQLRYTTGPWSFSMENPETVYTPFNGNMAQVSGDDGPMPDFTARYLTKGDWGHFGIAGLVRQLKYQNGPLDQDDDSTGYGVSVSGRFNVGANDDLRYMITGGSGIGRYIGLALNNDAVLDAAGELENIDVIAGFVGWRHVFSPKLRGNLFYSRAEYDNETRLTGLGITKGAQSAHLNLIYTPLPKLDLGAELIWGQRELENGDRGDLNRLQTHVKYNF